MHDDESLRIVERVLLYYIYSQNENNSWSFNHKTYLKNANSLSTIARLNLKNRKVQLNLANTQTAINYNDYADGTAFDEVLRLIN